MPEIANRLIFDARDRQTKGQHEFRNVTPTLANSLGALPGVTPWRGERAYLSTNQSNLARPTCRFPTLPIPQSRRRGPAGPRKRPAPDRAAQGAGSQTAGCHRRPGLDDLGRRRHRLSRRHGRAVVRQYRLWPHRTRRGRGGADAAIIVFPAHRDEPAGCRAGREDQRADGRRLSHLFRQFGVRGERGRLQDRPAIHEARISGGIPLQDHQPLFRLPRHHARRLRRRRHGRAQGEVRAVFGRFRARRAALLLSLPVRPQLSELRPGLREEHGDDDPRARARKPWPR